MSLRHLPARWRPNAFHKTGDRVTIRNERNVFVLRKSRQGGSRLPKLPSTITLRVSQDQKTTAIVKLSDAQCEWWLERVVRIVRDGSVPSR